jgi:hypothetical protein
VIAQMRQAGEYTRYTLDMTASEKNRKSLGAAK